MFLLTIFAAAVNPFFSSFLVKSLHCSLPRSWTGRDRAHPGGPQCGCEPAVAERVHAPLHGGPGEPRLGGAVPAGPQRQPEPRHGGELGTNILKRSK